MDKSNRKFRQVSNKVVIYTAVGISSNQATTIHVCKDNVDAARLALLLNRTIEAYENSRNQKESNNVNN